MNVIVIKGRLTKDPELRSTQNGTSVCSISVAVDRGYGEHKATDFFECVFWKQGAEFVSKYFVKGQEILVQGEMQSRQWTDRENNKRISWEIGNARAEFCGSKNSLPIGTQSDNLANLSDRASEFAEIQDDEELPF